jgi:hypothetical protein
MAEAQKFVAIADFGLNLDNGDKVKQFGVRVGEELTFDGLYVEYKGEKGSARSLSKVIGEWIKPVGASIPVGAPVSTGPILKTRNATGGRILEASDVSVDSDTIQQQRDSNNTIQASSNEELKRLVAQYDKPAPVAHISERITDDLTDLRNEVKAQKASRLIVEDQDAQEVAKVSSAAKTGSEKKNVTVTVEAQPKSKSATVSHEQRVAKKTDYKKEASSSDSYKHLKIDKEGSGVEVRKVSAPAVSRNDVKSSTAESRKDVISEQDAVIETNYGKGKSTVVSSSTQTRLEQDVIMKTETSPVASKRLNVIKEASQEGVVVRKVSKIAEADVTTQDGITSKLTVSSGGEESSGEVTASSNSDIDIGEVVSSSAEDTVVDYGAGDDIDVNDILNGV